MKRDLDLVREILLVVEGAGTEGLDRDGVNLDGHDSQEIGRHIQLLHEAGYLIASYTEPDQGGIVLHNVERLTWKGHEFLDAARNDTVWHKVTASIRSKAAAVPFEVLSAMLVEATKRLFTS